MLRISISIYFEIHLLNARSFDSLRQLVSPRTKTAGLARETPEYAKLQKKVIYIEKRKKKKGL